MKDAAEPCPRGHDAQLESLAARRHAARPDLVRERAHRQLLRDLRLAHERARAAPADEAALAHEFVEGCPDREPRDAEVEAELPLGRDRLADRQLVDQVADALARLALLGHRPASGV